MASGQKKHYNLCSEWLQDKKNVVICCVNGFRTKKPLRFIWKKLFWVKIRYVLCVLSKKGCLPTDLEVGSPFIGLRKLIENPRLRCWGKDILWQILHSLIKDKLNTASCPSSIEFGRAENETKDYITSKWSHEQVADRSSERENPRTRHSYFHLSRRCSIF